MAGDNPPLIWIDCEMTGLSIENDALVEIAVLVTDEKLNILGDGVDLVIATSPRSWLECGMKCGPCTLNRD